MTALDELLKRTTIEFPFLINAEEIEDTLFEYLRQEVHCNIDYSILIRGNKRQGENGSPTSERYGSEFTATITKRTGDFIASSFRLLNPLGYSPNFFCGMRFDSPAMDSLEEFRALPTGEAQLRLMDSVRERVEEYFHQRETD